MNEKQAGGIQRRRSRAEVDGLVAEYEARGLSRQEFRRDARLSNGMGLAPGLRQTVKTLFAVR